MTENHPYHVPQFGLVDGITPVNVLLEHDGTVNVSRWEGDKRNQWTLDKDLKPVSHQKPNGDLFLYDTAAFKEMTAVRQSTDGHEHPASREAGGIEMLPKIMAYVLAASTQRNFPKTLADKLPAAYAALKLDTPDRRDPPG